MATAREHMAADLTTVFDPDEFGTAATWLPASGGPVAITGDLISAYAGAGDPTVVVGGLSPVFECAQASVPGVTHNDELVIGLDTYTVVGVEPDGYGLVSLLLEKE